LNAKTASKDQLSLGLFVRRNGESKLLARKPIAEADVRAARDETWWQAVRSGVLPEDLAAIRMEVLPGENLCAEWVDGFNVRLSDGKRVYLRHFANTIFASKAMAMKRELIGNEVITKHDTCFYFLSALPAEELPDAPGIKVRTRPNPVPMGDASLAEYREKYEPMPGNPEPDLDHGSDSMEPMPIFVDPDAWKQAHDLARRGGNKESGGILTGRLMRDADSTEVFMVVDACLEAEQATEREYSVSFSGETWSRIRRILEQRRKHLDRPGEIIVGSVHGHNFMVGENAQGASKCETCEQRHLCCQTTAFASPSDMDWHRVHFTGQPWCVLLVWGWNARRVEEWRLYGLSGAVLAPRGLYQRKTYESGGEP
jgi:hypothetical protein